MTIGEHLSDDGVAELVLAHPPVNAYTIGDLHDLAARLDAIDHRPEVRAVIFRAEGRGFCGGGDLKEVQGLEGFAGILGQSSGSYKASIAIAECAVPVVVAIHNYCIGVGVLLAGAADIVVADDQARFVMAEIDNGATGGAIQACGLMPEKRLRSAMFTCEPVSASELYQYGSIYELVTDEAAVVASARADRVDDRGQAAPSRAPGQGVDQQLDRPRHPKDVSDRDELYVRAQPDWRRGGGTTDVPRR